MSRYISLLPLVLICLFGCAEEEKDLSSSQSDANSAPQLKHLVQQEQPWTSSIPASEIESLIQQLQSPHQNPVQDNEFSQAIPKGFDQESQKKILLAKDQLKAMGKDAFPALIEHMDRQEFSLLKSSSIWKAYSVGQVCEMIIKEQLYPSYSSYEFRQGNDGSQHVKPDFFLQNGYLGQEGLRRWWKECQHLDLLEMKIIVAEWQLKAEKEIGYSDKVLGNQIHMNLNSSLESLRTKASDELK